MNNKRKIRDLKIVYEDSIHYYEIRLTFNVEENNEHIISLYKLFLDSENKEFINHTHLMYKLKKEFLKSKNITFVGSVGLGQWHNDKKEMIVSDKGIIILNKDQNDQLISKCRKLEERTYHKMSKTNLGLFEEELILPYPFYDNDMYIIAEHIKNSINNLPNIFTKDEIIELVSAAYYLPLTRKSLSEEERINKLLMRIS